MSTVFDNCEKIKLIFLHLTLTPTSLGLNSFVEPCNLVYDVPNPAMDEALVNLKKILVFGTSDNGLTDRCRNQRIERVRLNDEAIEEIVSHLNPRL